MVVGCKIWRAIKELYTNKSPVDEISLTEYLVTHSKLPEKELVVLIGQICSVIDVPTRATCINYARSVIEHSRLRRLQAVIQDITSHLNDKERTVSDLMEYAESAITELSMNACENDRIFPVCDLVPDVLNELQGDDDNEFAGIFTGITGLDNCLHGLKPGQVLVLAARPAMGKTAIALNIASLVAETGNGVLFISLEMSANELMMRLIALLAGINLRAYREGFCARGSEEKLQTAGAQLAKLPIIIDDYCMQGVNTITSTIRRMQRKYGVKLVIIDYLQLISPRSQNIPREQQIAEISRALKFTAKTLNIPIICLAQLNRSAEIENRSPRLSDLRESGTIEQDADIVAFLDRNEDTRKFDESGLNFVERDLIVAKNRSGTTTRVQLMFNRGAMVFKMKDGCEEHDKINVTSSINTTQRDMF